MTPITKTVTYKEKIKRI